MPELANCTIKLCHEAADQNQIQIYVDWDY